MKLGRRLSDNVIMDHRVSGSDIVLADLVAQFGGAETDYELIVVPTNDISHAMVADFTKSNHDGTVWTWGNALIVKDYIAVTPTPADVSGVITIPANGTDTVVFSIQKKAGADDTDMVGALDSEEIEVIVDQLVDITSVGPFLANGLVSVTFTTDTRKGPIKFCFRGANGEFRPVSFLVKVV